MKEKFQTGYEMAKFLRSFSYLYFQNFFREAMTMEKTKKFVLVPWDFTPVAENALLHAIKVAKMVDHEIVLQHITKSKLSDTERNHLFSRLEKISAKYTTEYRIPINPVITVGSIFTSISEYANENKVRMVVMGTHGMKGVQKITGSWALKVIVGTKAPFLVVQEKPANWSKYKNIVFPVDFKSENKEKIQWAIYMGKYFDSKIHILKAKISDKSLLKKTTINLNYAAKYLIQNGIEYEIHELPKSGNFAKDSLIFAQDMNADVILITTTKNITVASYVLGAQEQYIIANSSKIPVLCVNPMASAHSAGFISV